MDRPDYPESVPLREDSMGKLGWVVALAAVAVRTEAAGAATVVRLDARDNGRLVVPVRLNGKGAYPFLVDTGAGTTVLGHKLAEIGRAHV